MLSAEHVNSREDKCGGAEAVMVGQHYARPALAGAPAASRLPSRKIPQFPIGDPRDPCFRMRSGSGVPSPAERAHAFIASAAAVPVIPSRDPGSVDDGDGEKIHGKRASPGAMSPPRPPAARPLVRNVSLTSVYSRRGKARRLSL